MSDSEESTALLDAAAVFSASDAKRKVVFTAKGMFEFH
jgi:hypothetical protein